jgi:integrase
VKRYLKSAEALKKPNTLRKYKAVLNRFVEFMPANADPRKITREDLTDFMVALKNRHKLGNNTVIQQMIIVAQFLKRHGKGGVTRDLGLPEQGIILPREYGDADLRKFLGACTPAERAVYATFLYTGFREQEVVHLFWTDINFNLNTIRVAAKPDLGFSAKRWEGTGGAGGEAVDGTPTRPSEAGTLPVRVPIAAWESRMAHAGPLQGYRPAGWPRSSEIRFEDVPLHVRDQDAPRRVRCPHGAALDGAPVARNHHALLGARRGRARPTR